MNGILCINKPEGFTSFDVVAKLRGILRTKKIGHAGTLDPMATGVLPVFVGNATKACDIMPDSSKAYRASFRLGQQTDTQDSTGNIIRTSEVNCSKADVISVLPDFTGDIMQIPPMYSAVSVNGKRLYELARQGIEVEREGRNITIYNIENIKINNPFVSMKVTCSKGTYIRSLCYDIGEKLGVYAAMTELNRAETSVFKQEDSINIKDLTSENYSQYLISIEEALNHYERININHKYAKLLVNGVRVGDTRYTNDKVENEKLYRVYDGEKFLGLGSKNDKGFKINKLLIT